VFVVCCACSGLCDGLITRSEEPHRGYVSSYVRCRNINNEAAEGRARLLRHRKENVFKNLIIFKILVWGLRRENIRRKRKKITE